jgi:phage terminase large subunit-like protein
MTRKSTRKSTRSADPPADRPPVAAGPPLVPVPEQYARDAAAGRVVCSREVQLAARRHLDDLRDGPSRGLRFDPAAAQHVLDFFQFLRHSKGEWAGQTFDLGPWEQFILWVLFGWKRADGFRRFRTAYIEVARKNGKSTLSAGVGFYLFFADGEPGAEVYCAATKKDQASRIFDEAAEMRKKSPSLAKRIVKFRDNMHVAATGSKFEPLGADADTLDGLNVHGAIVDELHAHKTRFVYDVLDTGTAARRQPMMFAITTAGFNRQSVCWHQHDYCEKVLEGIVQDDTVFAYIATLDPKDDWEDPANWVKANPNLGISVKLDDLTRKAEKAKSDPSALNSFLRSHLNQWTQTDTRWMPLDVWQACAAPVAPLAPPIPADPALARAEFLTRAAGRRCFGGLDLSSKVDLTAFALIFPPVEEDPRWYAVPWFWMPEDNVEKRVKQDRVPYDVWIRQGWIETTDGNVIDYDRIRAHIVARRDEFEIEELAFDPWSATQLAGQLQADGILMVEHRQGFASMSGPTKELMTYALGRKLAHLGNPVLAWMASNMVVATDPAGNIKPNKEKASEKIDGLVALIMALGRALPKMESGGSVYDSQGLTTL